MGVAFWVVSRGELPFNPLTFMKRLIIPACAALAAIGLCSCETTESTDRNADRASRFGYAGDTATTSQTTSTTTTQLVGPPPVTTSTVVETTPAVTVTPDAPVVIETTVKKDYPYGTPVSGKQGFVTSPHAPYSGYVDVRGFPPGTEVKDPYTGKIFLVP